MFLKVIAVESSEILNLRQEHQFLSAESKGKTQVWCVWKGSLSPEAKTFTLGTLYLQGFKRETSKCGQCPPIPAELCWRGNSLPDIWCHLTQDILLSCFSLLGHLQWSISSSRCLEANSINSIPITGKPFLRHLLLIQPQHEAKRVLFTLLQVVSTSSVNIQYATFFLFPVPGEFWSYFSYLHLN